MSDVVMPQKGGIALAEALRQRGKRTPVILISGHPMGEDRARLARAVAGALQRT